jgi:hypothetical protein
VETQITGGRAMGHVGASELWKKCVGVERVLVYESFVRFFCRRQDKVAASVKAYSFGHAA